jgi:hypothetical protein
MGQVILLFLHTALSPVFLASVTSQRMYVTVAWALDHKVGPDGLAIAMYDKILGHLQAAAVGFIISVTSFGLTCTYCRCQRHRPLGRTHLADLSRDLIVQPRIARSLIFRSF